MKAAELAIACFLLFGASLVWPLLAIANRPIRLAGVPLLAVYLFAMWGAIVLVLFMLSRRANAAEDDE